MPAPSIITAANTNTTRRDAEAGGEGGGLADGEASEVVADRVPWLASYSTRLSALTTESSTGLNGGHEARDQSERDREHERRRSLWWGRRGSTGTCRPCSPR